MFVKILTNDRTKFNASHLTIVWFNFIYTLKSHAMPSRIFLLPLVGFDDAVAVPAVEYTAR